VWWQGLRLDLGNCLVPWGLRHRCCCGNHNSSMGGYIAITNLSPKVNGICISQYMFMCITYSEPQSQWYMYITIHVLVHYTNICIYTLYKCYVYTSDHKLYIHMYRYYIYIYIYKYICNGSAQNVLVTFTICFLECHQLYVYVFLTYTTGCNQQTTRSVAVCAQARPSNVGTFMGDNQWVGTFMGGLWKWRWR